MRTAAARSGDRIVAGPLTHVETKPGSPPPTVSYTCDFSAAIVSEVSTNVMIGTIAAAIRSDVNEAGSHPVVDPVVAANPSSTWAPLVVNVGRITGGSATVLINGKPAVRDGDAATGCGSASSKVVVQNAAAATVVIGD